MTELIQAGLDRLWNGEVAPAEGLRQLKTQLQPLLPRDLPA
jgi:hypothetical protein